MGTPVIVGSILIGLLLYIYQTTDLDRITSPRIGKHLFVNSTQPFRRKVLIVADYRGGSTFSGELFNKNSQAAYLFETLYLAGRYHGMPQREKALQARILRNYFDSCNIPSSKEYLVTQGAISASDWNYKDKDYKLCSKMDTCFYYKNRLLQEIYQSTEFKGNPWIENYA